MFGLFGCCVGWVVVLMFACVTVFVGGFVVVLFRWLWWFVVLGWVCWFVICLVRIGLRLVWCVFSV